MVDRSCQGGRVVLVHDTAEGMVQVQIAVALWNEWHGRNYRPSKYTSEGVAYAVRQMSVCNIPVGFAGI